MKPFSEISEIVPALQTIHGELYRQMLSAFDSNVMNILDNLNCEVVHFVIGEVGHFGACQKKMRYINVLGELTLVTYQGSNARNRQESIFIFLVDLLPNYILHDRCLFIQWRKSSM